MVTWATGLQPVRADLDGRTVRDVVRTSAGGEALQVSLSNLLGERPVVLRASMGLHAGGGALEPGSVRPLTVAGARDVVVGPGEEVLSDPVPGPWAPQLELAVSVHVDGDPGTVSGHVLATATSYLSDPGDSTLDEGSAAFPTAVTSWSVVDAVLVTGVRDGSTVVALGDSLTDGDGSTPGEDRRYPDALARRLLADPGRAGTGVANLGVSGDQLLVPGAGAGVLARLDRDVLGLPGLETVVLLAGTNDLLRGAAADDVVAGLERAVERAHAAGVCVVAATVPPFAQAGPAFAEGRRTVNDWVRGSGVADAVLDADAALRDPADPDRLLPEHDSGDGLHPGDAGYAALAAAVDLDDLDCDR
ncbi:GDSL-type esterase/lipase family protein [Pseudokineococcus marinus]|uniref:SGNH/GDSL hydrolase family protein n=1 Tax=Pseudokineococcus marinus TaxID=351215 RepID=A0A849BJV7_9ACTN|nr:GDSL-type esterase/lipase family protein [Pseudokineococcus marinus]NNH23549.1 SGNH/GDSL hydrolase family protein [Pseudokineococcus marinus]